MDENYVAEIHAGARKPPGGGTGYLVAPGCVLSAHHVLGEPGLDCKGAVCEVRFIGDWKQGRHEWRPYEVAWNDPARDLALLVPQEKAVRYGAGLVRPTPFGRLRSGFIDCEALGFPIVQRVDNRNDTHCVRGRIDRLTGLKSGRLTLVVANGTPKDEEAWKGISGAAVFSGGRLIGVIIDASRSFREGVLHVQPVAGALDDAAFRELVGSPVAEDIDTGPVIDFRPELARLVHLVDRAPQVSTLTRAIRPLRTDASGRAYVAVIAGEPDHAPIELINRLRMDTLPQLFGNMPGFDRLEHIEWVPRSANAGQGLAALQVQLENLLSIDGPVGASREQRVQAIAEALNSGVGPRGFYSVIQSNSFNAVQCEVLDAWLDLWADIAGRKLNQPVGVYLCLEYSDAASPPTRPWWKLWPGSTPPCLGLRDYAMQQFAPQPSEASTRDRKGVSVVLLPPLEYCNAAHIVEWGKTLDQRPTLRWMVRYVERVRSELEQHAKFPLRAIRSAIEKIPLDHGRGAE